MFMLHLFMFMLLLHVQFQIIFNIWLSYLPQDKIIITNMKDE